MRKHKVVHNAYETADVDARIAELGAELATYVAALVAANARIDELETQAVNLAECLQDGRLPDSI